MRFFIYLAVCVIEEMRFLSHLASKEAARSLPCLGGGGSGCLQVFSLLAPAELCSRCPVCVCVPAAGDGVLRGRLCH